MAANVRFHAKYHAANHHTNNTAGLYDSGCDPLASAQYPFQGDFYLNGTLSAHKIVGQTSYTEILSAGGYATNVNSVSGNYTMSTTDQTLFLDANLASVVLLPSASAVPSQEFTFKRISPSAIITLSARGNELIDMTYNSIELDVQYSLVHLLSYQNNWWILYTQ